MIKHGLISDTDALTIEMTLGRILQEFPGETIYTTEVGVNAGETSRGINEYITSAGFKNIHTGIDSQKDFKVTTPFPECRFIKGESIEVYNTLMPESQHFIFIDANHSFPFVIADLFCYESKVMKGGYLAFHDTGAHIKPFTGFQNMGSPKDEDMYIAVRKALKVTGLLSDELYGWRLVYDEADINNEMGGVCVFKKYI